MTITILLSSLLERFNRNRHTDSNRHSNLTFDKFVTSNQRSQPQRRTHKQWSCRRQTTRDVATLRRHDVSLLLPKPLRIRLRSLSFSFALWRGVREPASSSCSNNKSEKNRNNNERHHHARIEAGCARTHGQARSAAMPHRPPTHPMNSTSALRTLICV